MEIITNYSNDTRNMISGSSYTLPSGLNQNASYKIKLSVFSNAGTFLGDYILEANKEYYVKNGNLFLRPNELLDTENFIEGNYTLRFDFITRYEDQSFYVSEISPTRKEVRLSHHPAGEGGEVSTVISGSLNEGGGSYAFNSFLELGQGRLIPINSYAFDITTGGVRTLILKLNTLLPGDVSTLSTDFHISNKWLGSQEEDIFFIDREKLAISGKGLEIDEGYILDPVESIDDYTNYNDLISGSGLSVIKDFQRAKKDRNLNIDYSKFSNHTFFGSAEQKLKNFKNKAVKLEGLYNELSSSLSFSSSKHTILRRKDLFNKIDDIKDEFTAYEYFSS